MKRMVILFCQLGRIDGIFLVYIERVGVLYPVFSISLM